MLEDATGLPVDDSTAALKTRRDKHGAPIPNEGFENVHHFQLGTRGSREPYVQAREITENGVHVRDVDFTDHGYPDKHTNPHQHRYVENSTGGTRKRGDPEPFPPRS